MSLTIGKLKKQLIELSEVVNAFQSEQVQLKVIDKLLDALLASEFEGSEENGRLTNKATANKAEIFSVDHIRRKKKYGATKVLNQILKTDFFNSPHSIASIAEHCKGQFGTEFKTSALSGILLKLAKDNKLKRQRNGANRKFEYSLVSQVSP